MQVQNVWFIGGMIGILKCNQHHVSCATNKFRYCITRNNIVLFFYWQLYFSLLYNLITSLHFDPQKLPKINKSSIEFRTPTDWFLERHFGRGSRQDGPRPRAFDVCNLPTTCEIGSATPIHVGFQSGVSAFGGGSRVVWKSYKA